MHPPPTADACTTAIARKDEPREDHMKTSSGQLTYKLQTLFKRQMLVFFESVVCEGIFIQVLTTRYSLQRKTSLQSALVDCHTHLLQRTLDLKRAPIFCGIPATLETSNFSRIHSDRSALRLTSCIFRFPFSSPNAARIDPNELSRGGN